MAELSLKRARLKKYQQQQGYHPCQGCGLPVKPDVKLCQVCAQKELHRVRLAVGRILRDQPWLEYDDLQKRVECDKILFMAVKDDMKAYYFGKVEKEEANPQEELTAVLLQSGKQPAEINDREYQNILTFLRGKKNVCTSRRKLSHQQ